MYRGELSTRKSCHHSILGEQLTKGTMMAFRSLLTFLPFVVIAVAVNANGQGLPAQAPSKVPFVEEKVGERTQCQVYGDMKNCIGRWNLPTAECICVGPKPAGAKQRPALAKPN